MAKAGWTAGGLVAAEGAGERERGEEVRPVSRQLVYLISVKKEGRGYGSPGTLVMLPCGPPPQHPLL